MSKIASFVLAGMMALGLAATYCRADAPELKSDKPTAVAAPLTDDGLRTMLENMGYDAKAAKADKTVIYTIKIDQGGWTYYIDVALSNDKDQLWITSSVADAPVDGKLPAETLLQLLEETNNIGPAAVYYDKQFKKIKVAMPLLNHGGITPAVFRTYLNDYMKDVTAVQKLCDFSKLADKVDAKKVEEKSEAKK